MALSIEALWFSGWLLNGVIVFTLLEAAGLMLYHHLTGRGLHPKDYALNLVSGLCLMLAVRSAVLNDTWLATVTWLSAAGLAHGADVVSRWRRQG